MWKKLSDGHYVLVEAAVYTVGEKWPGIWHRAADDQPRILQETFENGGRAMQSLEQALVAGTESGLWQTPTLPWREIAAEDVFYSPLAGAAVVYVQRRMMGSWYVSVTGGAMLGQNGRPCWFSTADEAKRAALRLLTERGESGLEWISQR
jgi:hypothetical protein